MIPRPQLLQQSGSVATVTQEPTTFRPQLSPSVPITSRSLDVPPMQPHEHPYPAMLPVQHQQHTSDSLAASAQQPPTGVVENTHNQAPCVQHPAVLNSHLHAQHAPSLTPTQNPGRNESAQLATHANVVPEHQSFPSSSVAMVFPEDPATQPQATEATTRDGADSSTSEYHHPAAVPENAHMRPDVAHAHLRPPVSAQHDSQILYGLTGQPPVPVVTQTAAPVVPSHPAEVLAEAEEQEPQPDHAVPAPVPAPQVHTYSPSPPHPQQQGELPYVPDAALATPSMHGWPHVRSSGSIVRSPETQVQMERARAAAVEQAGVHCVTGNRFMPLQQYLQADASAASRRLLFRDFALVSRSLSIMS